MISDGSYYRYKYYSFVLARCTGTGTTDSNRLLLAATPDTTATTTTAVSTSTGTSNSTGTRTSAGTSTDTAATASTP
jgi:hypothetical protein